MDTSASLQPGPTHEAKLQKCVFGLCVKNNAVGLPKVFHNISQISKLFSECTVVAYYDVSKDNSLNLLDMLSAHYNIRTIVLNREGTLTVPGHRPVNIARARNGILKEVYTNPLFRDYELFAMMDSNNYSCQGDIRPDVIGRYLGDEFLEQWDSLSFARKPYYDLWAYSAGVFQFGCWSYPRVSFMGSETTVSQYQEAMRNHINATLLSEHNAGKLVEVDSAFCGLAFYRIPVFEGCFYDCANSYRFMDKHWLAVSSNLFRLRRRRQAVDCEHRHFHMMAKRVKGAKIMVACDQAFGHFDSS